MKKITFFIGSLTGGGAERVVCNLSNYLVQNGHSISILTMSDIARTYELDNRVTVHPLIAAEERKGFFYNAYLRYRRLGAYMKNNKTDCYVVFLPVTIAMMLSQRRKTSACIIASERNDPKSYNKAMQWLQKKLSKRADGYVFQTEEAMQFYAESCLPKERCVVIPNAINPAFVGRSFSGKRTKRIVNVGRLTAQKNQTMLIDAFAAVHEQYPEYQLEIFGEGPLRQELENQINQLGLKEAIRLPGRTEDVIQAIQDAAAFVLSSDYEGMPNALAEAMALGIPCISTDCPAGGARYLVRDGENGVLIPTGDTSALASAICRLLSNELYAESLGVNARKIAETLSANRIYREWESFILQTIEKSSH